MHPLADELFDHHQEIDYSNKENRMDLYAALVEKKGKDNQLEKLEEECLELRDAMRDYRNVQTELTKRELICEMADVLNMIDQAIIILNIHPDHIEDIRNQKLNRTKNRYGL